MQMIINPKVDGLRSKSELERGHQIYRGQHSPCCICSFGAKTCKAMSCLDSDTVLD